MLKDKRPARAALVFALLAAALVSMFVLNLNIGSVKIAPGEIMSILSGGSPDTVSSNVIWKIRLPRLIAAAVLGGALSVSGFMLQTFFRNPIAGPYVLGISSGAKLFVGATMVFFIKYASGAPFWLVMLASFAGSMLVTGFVLLFSSKVRSMATLLVVGIMIGSICSAITDFMITFADESNVANLHAWSMGSFSAVSWQHLGIVSAIILVAVICAFLLSKPISAYRLGENYARSMGLNVRLFRIALIGLSSLLSSCVTALSGPISFVGVAVPHMTKLLFASSKPSVIIPGSFMLGAAFCMGCDLIARTVFSPSELAISTVTAVFGAPVVISLMVNRRRRREDG